MNKTFKVARSLTRGTVVTSEKASSYQGKAVKTVIAAAVASLVAGVAMAAPTDGDIQITDSTLTVQGTDTPNTTETLKGITAWDANAAEYKPVTKGTQLADDKNYDLVNGNIVVEPKADVAGSFTVNTLTGTGGLTIKATNQTAETNSEAVSSTLTIKAGDLAAQDDDKAQTITVTFEGTNAVTAGKNRGVSTLKLADTVALGFVDKNDSSKNDSVALVVKDNAKALVDATTQLDLNNVVLQNAGILTCLLRSMSTPPWMRRLTPATSFLTARRRLLRISRSRAPMCMSALMTTRPMKPRRSLLAMPRLSSLVMSR